MTKIAQILLCLAVMSVPLCAVRPALAYPWMIRHGYAGCSQCHADPSGAGLLTAYGRAQSELLLRSRYDGDPAEAEGQSGDDGEADPTRLGELAFGAFHGKWPESLLLQVDARLGLLHVAPNGPPSSTRLLQMQSDVVEQWSFGRLRENVSLSYLRQGGQGAWVFGDPEVGYLASRHHWVGVALGKDEDVLLRVGRMNLPFGLRSTEHTLFARTSTRTDTNASQQHGVALSYSGQTVRAEAMLVAGNFQLSPDKFRERGLVGYVEYAFSPRLAAGASVLFTRAAQGFQGETSVVRQAYGPFVRFSPTRALVLSAEVDVLASGATGRPLTTGLTGLVEADVEVWQGLHLRASPEWLVERFSRDRPSFGVWSGMTWFFLPHVDIRGDVIWRTEPGGVGTSLQSTSALVQLHAFL